MPKVVSTTRSKNLVSMSNIREPQVYGEMFDALYPYVSKDGTVNLHDGAEEINKTYDRLLWLGYAAPVVQFLSQKAILDIPEIKTDFEQMVPEYAELRYPEDPLGDHLHAPEIE